MMRSKDDLAVYLDGALDAVEWQLNVCPKSFSPQEIADAFIQHCATHLVPELEGIKKAGSYYAWIAKGKPTED